MEPVPSEESPAAESPVDIVARAGTYYRWTRYIVSVGVLMIFGSLCIRDGFFVWPRELADARRKEAEGFHDYNKPQTEASIHLQQILGLVMPPLGLALLLWTLYNSRGEYRLAGQTLHVPGHPPVLLESILKIDKTLWDRKGIAYVEYLLPVTEGEASCDPPASGTLKLDDFVYNQTQTDAILERIEQLIAPPADETQADEPALDSEE